MGVLRYLALAVAALPACYAPEVRDCTVSCASASDCAAGQVCGEDAFCAAPEVAGRCAQATADAGADGKPDGKPPPDAPPPPDAAPDAPPPLTVQLQIHIDGRGSVSSLATGSCDAGSGSADCVETIAKNVPLTLHAQPKNGWRFDKWRSRTCGGAPALCTFVPDMPTYVEAVFKQDDDFAP